MTTEHEALAVARDAFADEIGERPDPVIDAHAVDGGWRFKLRRAPHGPLGATDVLVRARDGRAFTIPSAAPPALVARVMSVADGSPDA